MGGSQKNESRWKVGNPCPICYSWRYLQWCFHSNRSRCSRCVLCITDWRCGLSRTDDQEDTRVFEGYSNDFWRSSYYCWACQGVWRVDESFVGARYDWRCSFWSNGKPVFIADDHICDIDNHRYVPGVYRSDYSFDTPVTANCCCIGNRPNRFWYSYGHIM